MLKWKKKHLSKQVVSITCTLEETFFAAATFEGLWVVSFETEWKNLCLLWSVWVFFAFLETRRPNNYCLWEVNSISYMQIFSLMYQNVNLVWNMIVWNVGCVFSHFCGGHKNNFPSHIRSSFEGHSCYHIEASQLICRAKQLTGFYMMATLLFNELSHKRCVLLWWNRTLRIFRSRQLVII